MILLLINEYANYRRLIITTLTYVDKNRGSDQIPVNIEVDLYNLPCELLSMEIRNDLGLVVQNIEGNLTKYNLNTKQEVIGQKQYLLENLGRFGHDHDHIAQPDYELVKQQLKNKEGCRLEGQFLHKIKDLYFGPAQDTKSRFARLGFLFKGLVNTLSGKQRINDKHPMIYQYYLKIVPSKDKYISGRESNKYQYTYNSFADLVYNALPILYFKYDLSPITIEYKHTKMSFLTFLINIFAILGGVFTIAGIIDAIIHKSVLVLLRKAEMNKIQ